jgi:hypothetical protein
MTFFPWVGMFWKDKSRDDNDEMLIQTTFRKLL